MLEVREYLTGKFNGLTVDSSAVKFFFKALKAACGNDDESFWQTIETMVEIIINEHEENPEDANKQLMCIRGLIMLVLNPEVARDRGQMAGTRILKTLNMILSKDVAHSRRSITDLKQHPFVVQFLAVMPYKMNFEIVIQL